MRKHYTLYPEQEAMEKRLCREYGVSPSMLLRRLLEYETVNHSLAPFRDKALQRPLYGTMPGGNDASDEL